VSDAAARALHGAGCGHGPVGDPHAEERLRIAVERLRTALASGDDEALALAADDAERVAGVLVRDSGPRTRAQSRGLLLALRLVRGGEREDAALLLDGELRRSFPGEAELDAFP
jgi:hypothetical protein